MFLVLKVGVIGCGRIASLLEEDPLREHPCTHAGAYREVEGVEIAAACDINRERLERFCATWDVERKYQDYRELLAQTDIEVVSVCTWHDSHAGIVVAAAKEPHMRAIICEKPVAMNLADGRKMVETAGKHNVQLVVNHERRWQSNYRKVKEIIDEGLIGPVRTVIGNILTGTPRADSWQSSFGRVGGGPLLHDGTHLIDIMRFLFGDALWVYGWAERNDDELPVEDTAVALILFERGVKAFIEGGGRRNYFNFELDIQGRDGRILIGNGLLKLWRSNTSSRYSGFYDLVEEPFPAFAYQNPYVAMVEELVSGKEQTSSSGVDGLAALEIIMAVYHSAARGGVKVALPFKKKYSPLKKMFSRAGERPLTLCSVSFVNTAILRRLKACRLPGTLSSARLKS